MNTKKKMFAKKWYVMAVMVCIFVFSSCFLAKKNIDNVYPVFEDEAYVEQVELSVISTNDIQDVNSQYQITGEDAYIVCNCDIEYARGVHIFFENSFEENGLVQLFWSTDGAAFSEKNSTTVSVDSGTNIVDIPVNMSDIDSLRIDVTMSQNMQFSISELQIDNRGLTVQAVICSSYTYIGNETANCVGWKKLF